jgi:hypothetical protein
MSHQQTVHSAYWPVPLPFAGLIAAASSARFFIHSSYSGVPRRGGTPLGIPPNHIGTLSATTALTGAQDVSIETALNNSRDLIIQTGRERQLGVFMCTIDTEIWL